MTEACRFCLSSGLLQDAPLFQNGSFYVLGMLEAERAHAVMIVLKRHAETPFEIAAAEWSDLAAPLEFAKQRLAAHEPAGFTVGWNVGAVAGQHVPHAHLHVICRFDGDGAEGQGLHALIGTARDMRQGS